ncbi:MAG: hypothetical protein PHW04_06785 [Candidatus Wallbacteria bacterium]|nr:hypothetical protein [Candidatus Wallbacteria bacterium]
MKNLIFILLILVAFSPVAAAKLLIVKDGSSQMYVDYYKGGLAAAAISCEVFDTVNGRKLPDLGYLKTFDGIMWICADSFRTLDANEKNLLDKFLSEDPQKQRSLFLEGDNLMRDSGFIDQGFFFRRHFDVEYMSNNLLRLAVTVPWGHPLTWGMRENFTIDTFRNLDTMKYSGFNSEEPIFKVQSTQQANNPGEGNLLTIGVARDQYRRRMLLLSFSPPVRNFWEISSTGFLRNLACWLSEDFRSLMKRLAAARKNTGRSIGTSIKEAVTMISLGIDNNSFQELDQFRSMKNELSPDVYSRICKKLMEIYYSNPDWQNMMALKARFALL